MRTVTPLRLAFSEAPNCAVGHSFIHGEGLFAIKAFKRGEVVADYSETVKSWAKTEYINMPPAVKELCWFVGLTNATIAIGSDESVFMRANHSKQGNCLWLPKQFQLIAQRDIAPGEEICYDYTLEIGPEENKAAANLPTWINS